MHNLEHFEKAKPPTHIFKPDISEEWQADFDPRELKYQKIMPITDDNIKRLKKNEYMQAAAILSDPALDAGIKREQQKKADYLFELLKVSGIKVKRVHTLS